MILDDLLNRRSADLGRALAAALLVASTFTAAPAVAQRDRKVPGADRVAGCAAEEPAAVRWRETFVDEFEGIGSSAREGVPYPAGCYDTSITPPKCVWYAGKQLPCAAAANQDPHLAEAPLGAQSNLAPLNKCVWSAYYAYNTWDFGRPYTYPPDDEKFGINSFHPNLIRVAGGEMILDAAARDDVAAVEPWRCGATERTTTYDFRNSRDCPIVSGAVMSGRWVDANTCTPRTEGFSQRYGRFAVRAKLPFGPGGFPAHWLLPDRGQTYYRGEIDILETTARHAHTAALHPGAALGTHHQSLPIGDGVIGQWTSNLDDVFVVGDFSNADPGDELLVISASAGQAHVMRWDGPSTSWQLLADDDPSGAGQPTGRLDLWFTNPDDVFVAGDFDADGGDELLAISAASGYAHVMEYVGAPGGWAFRSGNSGATSPYLGAWPIAAGDLYLAGEVDGDPADELVAIAPSRGEVHVIDYVGGAFSWAFRSDNRHDTWTMSADARFLLTDVDGDGRDELATFSPGAGLAQIMSYLGGSTSFSVLAHNAGSGALGGRLMHVEDAYAVLDVDGDLHEEVLVVSPFESTAQLLEYVGGTVAWGSSWMNDCGRAPLHPRPWVVGATQWEIRRGDLHVAGDFDGDGDDDLLSASAPGPERDLALSAFAPSSTSSPAGWYGLWSNRVGWVRASFGGSLPADEYALDELNGPSDALGTEYHVYAVEWDEGEVRWLVDGIEYHRVRRGDPTQAAGLFLPGVEDGTSVPPPDAVVPDAPMYFVLNSGIVNFPEQDKSPTPNYQRTPLGTDYQDFQPQTHHIDWVRAAERCHSTDPSCKPAEPAMDWQWRWGNQGRVGYLGRWPLDVDDTYLVADFDGNGRDELAAISPDRGVVDVMSFDCADWRLLATNETTPRRIALWMMNPGDVYLAADVDGDSAAELIGISAATGYVHVMEYTGAPGAFTFKSGNGGPGPVGAWTMRLDDVWVAGDWDGDGAEELMVFNPTTGRSQLLEYVGGASSWARAWDNAGPGPTAYWYSNAGDRYVAGDWDDDGRDELLAVARNGWAHRIAWNGTAWSHQWGNGGKGRIALRRADGFDQFVAGDFYDEGNDALAILSNDPAPRWGGQLVPAPSAQLLQHDRLGGWAWMRKDERMIGLWYLNPGDRFFAGDLLGEGRDGLLAISHGGWAHVMTLRR
ncbi:family 16 glycosylhydrolase [Myxococcota bacterium]|nr:family 16 glycosylhydrolase [Myxococcota bacterium]